MLLLYHLSQLFLTVASMQYHHCLQSPTRMPAGAHGIFHGWGAVSNIGTFGMFIAGFFMGPWWMSFSALALGMFGFAFLPNRWKDQIGPGLGFIATVFGVVSGVGLAFITT